MNENATDIKVYTMYTFFEHYTYIFTFYQLYKKILHFWGHNIILEV